MIKPWFLTEGKDLPLCSSYFPLGVSQLSGHNHHQLHASHQALFWHRCRVRSGRPLQGEFFARTSFTLLFVLLYFTLFLLALFYQKPKINRILDSCFYLSTFSFAEMANPENTKLCDFTSTKNSDFICTPIAPPDPAANFYEISLLY
jgi:hypothetical protein